MHGLFHDDTLLARWLSGEITEAEQEELRRHPDFPAFRRIVEAAERALRAGHTGYAPAAGLPELRAAIARHTGERRGLEYAPEQVVVTPGGKAVIFFT